MKALVLLSYAAAPALLWAVTGWSWAAGHSDWKVMLGTIAASVATGVWAAVAAIILTFTR